MPKGSSYEKSCRWSDRLAKSNKYKADQYCREHHRIERKINRDHRLEAHAISTQYLTAPLLEDDTFHELGSAEHDVKVRGRASCIQEKVTEAENIGS